MKKISFPTCLNAMFALVLGFCFLPADAADNGPTPYPDAHNETAWPGHGPIRLFNWMVDKRKAFWTQRENDRGAIVFVGDSLTDGWKIADMSKTCDGLKCANRGIGGDVSRGLLFRFREDVLALKPREIVLCIGTNDLTDHADPAIIEQNISAIIDQARQNNPNIPIVLCAVPPRNAPNWPINPGALTDLNARIVKLGEGKEHFVVVDLYSALLTPDGKQKEECFVKDHLHLAAPGYEIWANLLRPALKQARE